VTNEVRDLKEEIRGLKEKVGGLQTTRTVVLTLFAIFGITGAWVWGQLNQAEARIKDAQKKVEVLGKSVNELQGQVAELKNYTKAIADVKNAAVQDAKKEIADETKVAIQKTAPELNARMTRVEGDLSFIFTSVDKAVTEAKRSSGTEINRYDQSPLNKWFNLLVDKTPKWMPYGQ
jgi:outer membrane murein-binding lipoprotein Lpp